MNNVLAKMIDGKRSGEKEMLRQVLFIYCYRVISD